GPYVAPVSDRIVAAPSPRSGRSWKSHHRPFGIIRIFPNERWVTPAGLGASLIGGPLDYLDRVGRARDDRGLDLVLWVAVLVDHDGNGVVVLIEGVRGIPEALCRTHAQVPVDANFAVHCGLHGISP